MSNAIERDVYVLRNTLKNPISYVRGTDLLPIIFHFRDFTIPSGATATAFTAKPDGNAVYGSATISENDVTVDVQQQMFIVLGLSMLQVEIKSGGGTLATFVQPVMVEPNLKAGDFPPSTTDINFLDEVIEQSQEAVNNANQAIASANTAIEGANTAASSANQAAQNANQAAEDLQDKVDAGDFTASVQVGTTTTLEPGQDATVSNGGTSKDAVLNFGVPKGDPGTAATIQVGTTQTVQPEENAEVTNTGTTTAAVLNFKIPRGEDGMTDLTAEYKDASEYTCQPTVNAPVVVKELDGKTEQVETEGNQLFDASRIQTKSQGGATVTNNGDGSFTVSGNMSSDGNISYYDVEYIDLIKILKPGNLNFKVSNTSNPYFFISIANEDRSIIKEISNAANIQQSLEITEDDLRDNTLKIRFGFYYGNNNSGKSATIKPMVYQSGDGTWEPYTGGAPSPSPDYPQDITGVGGKAGGSDFSTEVETQGRNLCPPVSEWIHNSLQNRYETKIFLKGGKKYYASSNAPDPEGGKAVYYFKNTSMGVSVSYPILYTPEVDEYIDIYAYMGRTGSEEALDGTYYMQVEEGESPTDYTPYHHTAISIPLTSPLYEGDKICYVKPGESYVNAEGETVVADGILYGCYRENAEVVFDGSEDENWIPEANNRYRIGLNNSNNIYTENTAKCNFFKYNTDVYSDYGNEIGFIVAKTTFCCRFDSASEINSVSNLKAWLSNNPLTVVYKLAAPYFEPFTDQSIFYDLRTDDTLTYIYSSDPIEPNVTVEVAKNSTGGYLLESYAQAQKNALSEADNASRLASVEQQLLTLNTTVSTMGGQ